LCAVLSGIAPSVSEPIWAAVRQLLKGGIDAAVKAMHALARVSAD
jgi:hypothetical protein